MKGKRCLYISLIVFTLIMLGVILIMQGINGITVDDVADLKKYISEYEEHDRWNRDDPIKYSEYSEVNSFEAQGKFARVRDSSGWMIINNKGDVMISGLKMINPLPDTNNVGCAVKSPDDNVIIFRLPEDRNHEILVYELPQFDRVQMGRDDDHALVWDRITGLCGVVNGDGETVIPAEYKNIDFTKYMDEETGEFDEDYVWKLQREDGSYEIKKMPVYDHVPRKIYNPNIR